MTTLTKCPHHPWHTQFWLFIAVISNANASIIFFTTFIQTPFSYIASVIYIICYRFYLNIKSDNMPIAIDLCFSLLSETIVEYKSWEFALLAAFFINLAVFQVCCSLNHLFPEYCRLKEEGEPDWSLIIHPLCVERFLWAVIELHVFQGYLSVLMWFFPFGEEVYGFYQIFVGFFLVKESVTFFRCYRDMAYANVKDQKQS